MKTNDKIILLLFSLLFTFFACEQTDIDNLKVGENEQGLTERRLVPGNGGGTSSMISQWSLYYTFRKRQGYEPAKSYFNEINIVD